MENLENSEQSIPRPEAVNSTSQPAIHRTSTVSTLHHNQFDDNFVSRYVNRDLMMIDSPLFAHKIVESALSLGVKTISVT